MSYLNFITTSTCHGSGTENLLEGLHKGPGRLKRLEKALSPFFFIEDHSGTALGMAKSQWLNQLTEMENHDFPRSGRWGLILASTKGIIDDLVWKTEDLSFDTFTPIVEMVSKTFPWTIEKTMTISNACTSSHAALELGNSWLMRNWVDHVLVFGFDRIGPFTLKGFETLRALSPDAVVRPFDTNRNGLLLGDGVASCVISRTSGSNSLWIESIKSVCEGVSATRPDTSGVNLQACFQQSCQSPPDLILAHGTGTFYNDATESKAIFNSFNKKGIPPVTCSKWSLGHSLGVSGLLDLGLAFEMIQQQRVPRLMNLESCDLEIKDHLVKENQSLPLQSVLISSLGFGGMCSSLFIKKEAH